MFSAIGGITDVSFVILSFNHFAVLTQAVQSIVQHTKDMTYEVIVIDNDSPDGNIFEQCAFDRSIRVFKNPCNVGWSSAINQGLRYAKGRYICICDNDVLFVENSARILRDYCDRMGEKVVVGPRILSLDRTIQKSIIGFPTITNIFFTAIFFNVVFAKSRICNRDYLNYLPIEAPVEVQALMGTCLFFPASVGQSLGGFDEGSFLNGDIDFCKRFGDTGGTIFYDPSTSILHRGSVSTSNSKFRGQDHFIFDLVRFLRMHYGSCYRRILYVFLFLAFLTRFILWLTVGMCKADNNTIQKSLIFPARIYFLIKGVLHHGIR